MYSHFLSGTWNKHAEYMLLLCFPCFFVLFFCICHQYVYLHGTGRFASMDPSCFLTSSDFFCLYCMYFFKGFWGRPQKYRSACERGRTCIFTGYPPPLQLQSGLLCTCITEAPNKTHCGWLVRKRSALSGICVWLQPLQIFTPIQWPSIHSVQLSAQACFYVSHTQLIIKLYSRKTSAQIR